MKKLTYNQKVAILSIAFLIGVAVMLMYAQHIGTLSNLSH